MQKSKSILLRSLLLLVLLFLNVCSKSPDPINYGQDECEFCRMLITDNKFGAEIVSDKGKPYKFDSIECLVGFALAKNLAGDQTHDFLVADFSNPGNFTAARNASYVHNDNFRSPMGLNVSAFDSEISRQKFVAENGGDLLYWVEVIELVKQKDM